MIKSCNAAIFFGALELVQTNISQFFFYYDRTAYGLSTITTFKWRSGLPTFCISDMILVAFKTIF